MLLKEELHKKPQTSSLYSTIKNSKWEYLHLGDKFSFLLYAHKFLVVIFANILFCLATAESRSKRKGGAKETLSQNNSRKLTKQQLLCSCAYSAVNYRDVLLLRKFKKTRNKSGHYSQTFLCCTTLIFIIFRTN